MLTMPEPDGHASDLGMLHLLYGLVMYVRPALIIEAGTYKGHAAATMALALRDSGTDGEVWTADVKDYGARGYIAANGLSTFVHYYDGDFEAMLAGPLKDRRWRFAFVDSGLIVNGDTPAEEDMRQRHLAAAKQGLVTGGVIVVDDAASTGWNGAKALREEAGIYLANGRGVALVQSR